MTSAACRARPKRCRWGPNGPVIGTLPIGKPMDETPTPRSEVADSTLRSSSSVRSRTFVFQTLRSSMWRIDSITRVSSCSSRSGEISSANPIKVHTRCCPFWRPSNPLAPFFDTHGPPGPGRRVDTRDDRERLSSFFDGYGRLSVVPHGLDEVPYLVPVRHRETARIGARTGSRPVHATLLQYLLSLVFT